MYKVIEINKYTATKTVELENEITGHRDICFDDSALVSMNNFEFMQLGNSYDCYIKLFGEIAKADNKEAVNCKIISNQVVGCKKFIKVLVDGEIYYVPKNKMPDETIKEFPFTYTRKDLIKVDEVIHDDLLSEDKSLTL